MEILVIILSGAITGTGVIYLTLHSVGDQGIRRRVNKALKRSLSDDGQNILSGTHYYLSVERYNLILLCAGVFTALAGIATLHNSLVVLAVAGCVLLQPRENAGPFKTPFSLICGHFRKKDAAMKDQELLEILSLLKNMMVQLRNDPLGSDYIIEYLAENAELTKSAFYKMQNMLRLGNRQQAGRAFIEELGTPLAADAGRAILQLDEVEPYVLEQSLLSIEKQVRESESTHKRVANERYSDLILVPIVFTAMLVFVNFLMVAFIADLTDLSGFFNM